MKRDKLKKPKLLEALKMAFITTILGTSALVASNSIAQSLEPLLK